MVNDHTGEKDNKPNGLQVLERLPANSKREDPDEESADAVQDHARDGTDHLRHRDTGKVEEGNANDIHQDTSQDQVVISNLLESVNRILKASRLERRYREPDEVEWNQEGGENAEAKDTLPANSLQSGHVVLLNKLLLPCHLKGNDELQEKKDEIEEAPKPEHGRVRRGATHVVPQSRRSLQQIMWKCALVTSTHMHDKHGHASTNR